MKDIKLTILFSLVFCGHCLIAQEIFDTQIAGGTILKRVEQQAASENKLVLVLFGANWCPWCQAFDKTMNAEPVKSYLERTFVLAKIDVGHFDRNTDLSQQYMADLPRKQIPFLVALSPDGTVIGKIQTKELEEGQGYDSEKVLEALKNASGAF